MVILKKTFLQMKNAYQKMDFSKLSQEEVQQKLYTVLESKKISFKFGEITLNDDSYFVRVRTENDGQPYNHYDEFWAPPANSTTLGRCNKDKQPKLYTVVGTNINRDLISVTEETNLGPGSSFVVIVYKLKSPLTVPISLDLFPSIDTTQTKTNSVSKFLISEFTVNPEHGIKDRYKSTVAISELMMNPDGHRSKVPAFCYPSCALNRALKTEGNGVVNIAWEPDFAMEHLKIETLRRVRVDWDTEWNLGSSLEESKKSSGVYIGERGEILSDGSVVWFNVESK
ncbi:hypothetical protein BTO12_12470 [Vibrio splendidus]|nr:hypothetical protein BTO12_12470 [Vibrio splendidus]